MRACLVIILAACAAPAPPRVATPARAPARLLAAIDAGDYAPALRVLCDAYARAGLPCADTLTLETLEPDDVMSRVGDQHLVQMQPMPRDGLAYWDNWSRVLSNGAWAPRALFADERDARRIANTMLVTVLAHELGHHVAERHGCHPFDGPHRELRADELSVPVVRELMSGGELGELHGRMRAVADAMIAAVPEGTRVAVPADADLRRWVDASELPSEKAAYASLHLSRQRRLLAGPPMSAGAAAETFCLPAWRERLAGRRLLGATVTTVGPLQGIASAAVALDRDGHVFAVDMFGDEGQPRTIRRLDTAAPPRVFTGPDDYLVQHLAAASTDRMAISDGVTVWILEGKETLVGKELPLPPGNGGIAFDERGELIVSRTVDDVWSAGPLSGPARWSVPIDHLIAETDWGDGKPGRASPRAFAVDGDRVVFADVVRDAVRVLGPAGVATLAGSRAGRRDGPGATAELYGTAAIAVQRDGRISIIDTAARDAVLRSLSPAR